MSTERYIIRRRISLILIPIRIEENRNASGNAHFPVMVVPVGNCEPSCRATPSQCRRTRVLQDEGEAVGAMTESALLRQPELERSVKAGAHVLLLQDPGRSRSIVPGRRQPQDLATGNRGIANQREPFSGGEAVEANGSRRRSDRAPKECDDQAASSCFHIDDYD